MIATGTHLDIMGFNKRRTPAVLHLLLIYSVQVKTASPDQAVRPSINTSHSHFPLSISLHLTPSMSFLNLHNSVTQISFLLHFDQSLLLLLSHSLIYITLSFSPSFPVSLFYLQADFTEPPPVWEFAESTLKDAHRLTLQSSVTLNCVLPKRAARIHVCVPQLCREPRGLTRVKGHAVSVLSRLTFSHSYMHIYTHKCKALHGANKTLQTTTQLSDVCVPTSPSRVSDTALLWFWWEWGVERNLVFHLNVSLLPGRHPVYCFTLNY